MNLTNGCHFDKAKTYNAIDNECQEDYFEKLLDMDTSSPEIGNTKDEINGWNKIVNLTNIKPQTALETLKVKNKNFKGQISVKKQMNICKKIKKEAKVKRNLQPNKIKVVTRKNPPFGILEKITNYSTTQKNTLCNSTVWPLTHSVRPLGKLTTPLNLNLLSKIDNLTNTFPKFNQDHSLELKKPNEGNSFYPSKLIKFKQSLPSNKNNQKCLLKRAMILFKKNNNRNQKENNNPQNNSAFNYQIKSYIFSKERFDFIKCKENAIEKTNDEIKFDKLFKKFLNQMISKRI